MSRRPALPVAERYRVMQTIARRRELQREIARLLDEAAALRAERERIPSCKDLAAQLGVCYKVVQRAFIGDPYVNRHPDDEQHA